MKRDIQKRSRLAKFRAAVNCTKQDNNVLYRETERRRAVFLSVRHISSLMRLIAVRNFPSLYREKFSFLLLLFLPQIPRHRVWTRRSRTACSCRAAARPRAHSLRQSPVPVSARSAAVAAPLHSSSCSIRPPSSGLAFFLLACSFVPIPLLFDRFQLCARNSMMAHLKFVYLPTKICDKAKHENTTRIEKLHY